MSYYSYGYIGNVTDKTTGAPISGVQVICEYPGCSPQYNETTDVNGYYSGVHGPYTASFHYHKSGYFAAINSQTPPTVPLQEIRKDIQLESINNVYGVVKDYISLSLLNNITVNLCAQGTTSPVLATDTTDSNGSYSIDYYPPGTYDLVFIDSSGQHSTSSVTVTISSTPTSANKNMFRTYRIHGKVTDLHTGVGIQNVRIRELLPGSYEDNVVTNSSGDYIAQFTTSGSKSLEFIKTNYVTGSGSASAATSPGPTLNKALDPV